MKFRFSYLLVLCVPLAASCLQKLDDGLTSGGPQTVEGKAPDCSPEAGFACNFEVNLTTPEIGLDHDPETGDPTDTAPATSACV